VSGDERLSKTEPNAKAEQIMEKKNRKPERAVIVPKTSRVMAAKWTSRNGESSRESRRKGPHRIVKFAIMTVLTKRERCLDKSKDETNGR